MRILPESLADFQSEPLASAAAGTAAAYGDADLRSAVYSTFGHVNRAVCTFNVMMGG